MLATPLYHSCYMPPYVLDVADIWARRGYKYSEFYQIYLVHYKIYVVLGMRLEMLVFRVVWLVSWVDYKCWSDQREEGHLGGMW